MVWLSVATKMTTYGGNLPWEKQTYIYAQQSSENSSYICIKNWLLCVCLNMSNYTQPCVCCFAHDGWDDRGLYKYNWCSKGARSLKSVKFT